MVTKKEFLAKILEISMGKPLLFIDRTYDDVKIFCHEKEGWIDVRCGQYQVDLDLKKNNPPRNEEDIVFSKRLESKYPKSEAKERYGAIKELPDIEVVNRILEVLKDQFKPRQAVIPKSTKQALYALQQDPKIREYGGGIDFEIIKGKPQIERILAYYGEKGQVPSRILGKYNKDVEVQFHTHPAKELTIPSIEDLYHIIKSPQQIQFIVGDNEIIVIEKTRNTPKTITIGEIEKKLPKNWTYPTNKSEQHKMLKMIEKELNLRTTVIPRAADVVFDINVIKGKNI